MQEKNSKSSIPMCPGSGVAQEERRLWFDTVEREGFEGAAAMVALSQPDREKLRELGAEEVEASGHRGIGLMIWRFPKTGVLRNHPF